jgi:hypothetical protein
MHEKTGHDNKGMSGHGFTFPVGGSVPVIFISMVFTLFKTEISFKFSRRKFANRFLLSNSNPVKVSWYKIYE